MARIGVSDDYYDPFTGELVTNTGGEGGGRESTLGGLDIPTGDSGSSAGPTTVQQDLTATDTDSSGKRRYLTPGEYMTATGEQNAFNAVDAVNFVNRSTGTAGPSNQAPLDSLPVASVTGRPATPTDVMYQGVTPNAFAAVDIANFANKRYPNDPGGTTPSLPDMAGTPAGPTAMAAGQGWFVDERGQFHSDNEGANIRANRPGGAGDAFSIGPQTIIDTGASRNYTPFQSLTTAGDYAAGNRRLPGNLGLTGGPSPLLPDMQGIPGLTGGIATGGAGGAATPYANYNARLGDTVAQTYGGPTTNQGGPGGPGGAPGLPQGFERQGNTRVVRGPDGTMYITDATGYLNPNGQQARDWQSRANIDANATYGGDPGAVEKIRYLDSIGQSTPEEKRFLQTIGPGNEFMQTDAYGAWVGRHNPEAQRLGLASHQLEAPARTLPVNQVFSIYKEYGDLLAQLGATNIQFRNDNHTLYNVGTDTPIMQWRSSQNNPMALSGDTPIANVLDDVAKLRDIAARRQQANAAAAAAGGAGGGGGGGGYGGRGYGSPYGGGGGGGGAGAAAAPPGGAQPWWSGTPAGRMWAGDPTMLANYANSPSYDAINMAQIAGGGIQTRYPNAAAGGGFAPTGDGATAIPWGSAAPPPQAANMPPGYGYADENVPIGPSASTPGQWAPSGPAAFGRPLPGTPAYNVAAIAAGSQPIFNGTPANNISGAIGNAWDNTRPLPGTAEYNVGEIAGSSVGNALANGGFAPPPDSPARRIFDAVGNFIGWAR